MHRHHAVCVMFCRAQDQASMQLSEMEEEMDQRIHAAERKTRDQVGPNLLPLRSPQSKENTSSGSENRRLNMHESLGHKRPLTSLLSATHVD